MKKLTGLVILALALLVSPAGTAQANISVQIGIPPVLVFYEPPRLVLLPRTQVYVAPGLDVDLFFHDGWWWRVWNGHWYHSRSYLSGWVYYSNVPYFYRDVPRDWRRYYRDRRWHDSYWDYRLIPHRDVERHWRSWKGQRYYDKRHNRDFRVKRPYPAPQYKYKSSPSGRQYHREYGQPSQKWKQKYDNRGKGKVYGDKGRDRGRGRR